MTQVRDPQVDEVMEAALDVAHVIYPQVEVGQKALTLCGLEWKVTVLFADIPPDYPICRNCVDVAVLMLGDAVSTAMGVMNYAAYIAQDAKRLGDLLTNEDSIFFNVVDSANKYQIDRIDKSLAKAERRAVKNAEKAKEEVAKKKKKKGRK